MATITANNLTAFEGQLTIAAISLPLVRPSTFTRLVGIEVIIKIIFLLRRGLPPTVTPVLPGAAIVHSHFPGAVGILGISFYYANRKGLGDVDDSWIALCWAILSMRSCTI